MKQFLFGHIRVQLLGPDILRLEYGRGGKFCDENTFHIPCRDGLEAESCEAVQQGNTVIFGNYRLFVPEKGRSLHGIRLEKDGKRVYTYKPLENTGELPEPQKTPRVFALADCPRITVPEAGYTGRGKRKNSGFRITEKVQDVYLLLCDGDPYKLRRLYGKLTGTAELVRLATLGSWNSKYFAYTEESAKQLILDYARYRIPLDNMVIDTDWRAAMERGIGYDLNRELFPDMGRFLRFAHDHGVEVMFNDHPEPVEGAGNLLDPLESRYREEKLQSLLKLGVDTWWYDRNWHTKLKSPTAAIPPETWGMYVFADITRHFYEKQAKSKQIYRRPVIMANVDNIVNGRYFGISNSASHRFSIQWTGDIYSDSHSLTQEVESMLRCGENGIPYANADCGGHLGTPDKEGFIRWMQFGTLSPVFRPHATNYVEKFREPWLYDEETLDIVRNYNCLRYRLLPVLYRAAYESWKEGLPIFRSMALAYPKDAKGAKRRDQYLLGENLLIAPITGPVLEPLPRSAYVTPVRASIYAGTALAEEPLWEGTWNTLDLSARETPIGKGLPEKDLSARFETTVQFTESRHLYLQCDDGATVWLNGEKAAQARTDFSAMHMDLGVLEAGKPYEVTVEYFQQGAERVCGLYSCPAQLPQKQVYLPEGRWMDAFTGKIYQGGKTVSRRWSLEEMPLFIRLGSVFCLAENAQNTRQQSWQTLTWDCYPGEAGDAGYLYEDDAETTAYRLGQYRTSAYEAGETEGGYRLLLQGAQGAFSGSRACENRNIRVKFHCLKGFRKVEAVTVNGQEVPFTLCKQDPAAFPLGTEGGAPDSPVVVLELQGRVADSFDIQLRIKK